MPDILATVRKNGDIFPIPSVLKHSARRTSQQLLPLFPVAQFLANKYQNLVQCSIVRRDVAAIKQARWSLLKLCFEDAHENFSRKYRQTQEVAYDLEIGEAYLH